MKNYFYFFFVVFTTTNAFSQDYKQKISKASCECLSAIKTENKSKKELELEAGLCMFKSATPYTEEFKRDYNIDLTKDLTNDEKMEDFGTKMAILLMNECPEKLISLIKNNVETDEVNTDSEKNFSLSGTISKVEKENFVIFYVVGDNKALNKLYWISNVESNLDLPKEYETLANKKVNVEYHSTEIFDAKLGDYKKIFIITSLRTE